MPVALQSCSPSPTVTRLAGCGHRVDESARHNVFRLEGDMRRSIASPSPLLSKATRRARERSSRSSANSGRTESPVPGRNAITRESAPRTESARPWEVLATGTDTTRVNQSARMCDVRGALEALAPQGETHITHGRKLKILSFEIVSVCGHHGIEAWKNPARHGRR